jgi:hypothetical protein
MQPSQMIGTWYEAASEQSRRPKVNQDASRLMNRKKLRGLQLWNAAQGTAGLLPHSQNNGFRQSQ